MFTSANNFLRGIENELSEFIKPVEKKFLKTADKEK